jgi:hypothetical protein
MKDTTDAKTRAAASTPGAEKLNKGEQKAIELQSESEHQTGTRKEKMVQEAKKEAGAPESREDRSE